MRKLTKTLGIGTLVLGLVSGCSDKGSHQKIGEIKRPTFSSEGMDIVMSGSSSWEVLSDWEVEREREFSLRDIYFQRCDKNKDGMLTDEEAKEYLALPIFNYRFR